MVRLCDKARCILHRFYLRNREKDLMDVGMRSGEPGPNAHNDLIEGMRRSGNWDEVIISSSEYTTLAHS